MPREDEPQCIVLAIRGIGELYLPQQRREEGTGRSKSVDAQGIVGSVLIRPLLMVDESWRQGIQFKVAHAVRAHHHRSVLFVESLHDGLKRLG